MSGLGESSVARRMLALMRRGNIDYQCFRVYARSLEEVVGEEAHTRLPPGYRFVQVSAADLEACAVAELRACASYGGPESYLFAIARDDGVPVCVQCIWHGTRYREHAFWPLDEREAASMHLVTAESERGKGLATCLKQLSAARLRSEDFSRIYSRIWWTNTASLRVSEKAGWHRVGTVFEIHVPWRADPIRRVRAEAALPDPALR